MLLGDYTMTNITTVQSGDKLSAIYPDVKYSPPPVMTFTETQKELMQKFNIAFYEAQSKSPPQVVDHENILETFDERYFTNIEKYEQNDSVDTFIDFLLPRSDSIMEVTPAPLPPPITSGDHNFDYSDFCEKFEEQVNRHKDIDNADSCNNIDVQSCSAETEASIEGCCSTSRSNYAYSFYTDASIFEEDVYSRTEQVDYYVENSQDGDVANTTDSSSFYIDPPRHLESKVLDNLELSDIELSESISNASLDLDNLGDLSYDYDSTYIERKDNCVKLPPVNTISKSVDFTNMLRNIGSDCLYILEKQVILHISM